MAMRIILSCSRYTIQEMLKLLRLLSVKYKFLFQMPIVIFKMKRYSTFILVLFSIKFHIHTLRRVCEYWTSRLRHHMPEIILFQSYYFNLKLSASKKQKKKPLQYQIFNFYYLFLITTVFMHCFIFLLDVLAYC